MKNDNLNLGGFSAVFGTLSPNSTVTTASSDDTPVKDDPIVEPLDDDVTEGDDGTIIDDTDDEGVKYTPPAIPAFDPNGKNEPDDDFDLADAEPEIVSYLQSELFTKFGFEMGDDDKFESVDDVVNFVKEVIDENSNNAFANDEIRKINDFVSKGGSLDRYLKEAVGEMGLDDINLENENVQRDLVREHLESKGYSASRIERMISRYEDAGTLYEEAEDALELVKEQREKASERLLEEQTKQAEAQKKAQLDFVKNVETSIKELDNIRGIPITQKEKKELMDYIFKTSSDGTTAYQRDYMKSVNNLVESAYFTKKGGALVDKIQRKSTSDAAKNLRMKLAEKGKRGKNQEPGRGMSDDSVWSLASTMLRKP